MARHKCPTCGKNFDLKRYLTKHEIRMHQNPKKSEEDTKNLKCSMCEKVFPRLSHLQRHQMTHLNVRNFACEFCDEKFVQKSHLTRHVSRKHANAPNCEISWTACDKCGKLFKTTYEMKRHRETHIRATCRKCGEAVEGNTGMYKHHMKCRNESNVCENCNSSFARKADLTAHETSCFKKVAFQCVPCDEYFKQRVQLDRHIANHHFTALKCTNCEHTSQSPVENARHSLACRKSTICGYCNQVEPAVGHVAEHHWRRLKRAVKVKKARREAERKREKEKTEEDSEDVQKTSVDDVQDLELEEMEKEEEEEEGPSTSSTIANNDSFDSSFDDFSESTSNQFDFTSPFEDSEDFLSFSICPNASDLKFDMAGRLPEELVELFPNLEDTSIVLLQSMNVPVRFTVQVPVFIPKDCENEEEMRKWMEEPIFVE